MSLSLPFRQKVFQHIGRALISERNFERGDVVWEEESLIKAPYLQKEHVESPYACVGCSFAVSGEIKCSECNLPCCSVQCSKDKDHRRFECRLYRKNRIPLSSESFRNIFYIRAMLYKRMEPRKYEAILNLCSDFDNLDIRIQKERKSDAKKLWRFAFFQCNLKVFYEETFRLINIFRINNFQYSFRGRAGQCIYEKSSLFSHSCCPNMAFSFFGHVRDNGVVDFKIRFHARRAIKKGDLLTISYAPSYHLTKGTFVRQSNMRLSRGFTCMCDRCQDKTEGGTYFSAIVCSECHKGNMLPMDLKQWDESPWKCDQCTHMKGNFLIRKMLGLLETFPCRLTKMKKGDTASVLAADYFIERHSGFLLHRNHYLIYNCVIHWLQYADFGHLSRAPEPERTDLFKKILLRALQFLPVAFQVEASYNIVDALTNLAQAFASFYFKSSDMVNISEQASHCRDKFRASKKILYYLKEAWVWVSMKPNYVYSMKSEKFLQEMTNLWTDRLEMFLEKTEQSENLALESIRFLFC